MPLYALLYSFSQLAVQRRYDLAASRETIKSIARSSFFIFFHAYNGSLLGCALRHSFGRFYFRILVAMPALLSSYLALLIEKPARRQALAFYLLNLASEIVYRMAVTKSYFRPIRHGETLLFAVSLGAWYRLLKLHGFGRDPVSAAVKAVVGRAEAAPAPIRPRTRFKKSVTFGEPEQVGQAARLGNELGARCARLLDSIGRKLGGAKHRCCPHQEATCFRYVLQPVPTRFLLGYSIQIILKLSARPYKLVLQPRTSVREAVLAPGSLRFGLFLAALVSSGRMTSCLLRRYSDSNEPAWHGSVAGFVAGLSMLCAPRPSVSMYVMWKAIEQYYLLAARQGKAPYFNLTILSIYSLSAATILYAFALEPRFVRPSYMKFLDRLSNHRLHQLNRMVLDVFGTGSSLGYEDYFPDLHPKYMSNQFKELIFNWMIQPYE